MVALVWETVPCGRSSRAKAADSGLGSCARLNVGSLVTGVKKLNLHLATEGRQCSECSCSDAGKEFHETIQAQQTYGPAAIVMHHPHGRNSQISTCSQT